MNTQISTKLTALFVALIMNGLIFSGVAYLFDASKTQGTNDSSVAGQPVATSAKHHVV